MDGNLKARPTQNPRRACQTTATASRPPSGLRERKSLLTCLFGGFLGHSIGLVNGEMGSEPLLLQLSVFRGLPEDHEERMRAQPVCQQSREVVELLLSGISPKCGFEYALDEGVAPRTEPGRVERACRGETGKSGRRRVRPSSEGVCASSRGRPLPAQLPRRRAGPHAPLLARASPSA